MGQEEVLIEYMNEHYAHARDHEALRAQITSILCAAAFVLIGLAISKDAPAGWVRAVVGIVVIALGGMNIWINWLHNNRFDAHVAAADKILEDLGNKDQINAARSKFKQIKKGSLSATWYSVPILVCVAGVLLVFYGACHS
jgi:Tryptophan-associated transmembrane protein (Trp_oprn_chp)